MKKYLKITGNEIITAENQSKADHFTSWFVDNYSAIKNQLIQKRALDEDVLHDIYLSIHKRILFGGFTLEGNIMPYFMCAYYLQRLKRKVKATRTQSVEASFFDFIKLADTSQEDIEVQEKENYLYQQIIDHVKAEYPESYHLFHLNMVADQKLSYEKLSKKEGLSEYAVGVKMRDIKQDLRSNTHLIDQRKAIV